MSLGNKEQLSEHVERIFRGYAKSGLHICDIATGGGKSYTIGKLACEFYPKHFRRVVILCVQKKLVEGMYREIMNSIDSPVSLIKKNDVLVVENNIDVITKAAKSGSLDSFLEEIDKNNGDLTEKFPDAKNLVYGFGKIKKVVIGLKGLLKTQETDKSEYIGKALEKSESDLRRTIKSYFETYRRHLISTRQKKEVTQEFILKNFPSLKEVYPQVECRKKKVLLMTIHKAMYSVDPILTEKMQITDLAQVRKGRALIIFDESDQAAGAMRNCIIEQAIDTPFMAKRFLNGYNGYLQLKVLTENTNHVSNEYFGNLEEALLKAKRIVETNWQRKIGDIEPFKSIFLSEEESLEDYRKGVFFSGPITRFSISQKNDNSTAYICYRNGERHFQLAHTKNEEELEKTYDFHISLEKFLTLIRNNTTAIRSQLRKIVVERLDKRWEEVNNRRSEIANNTSQEVTFIGNPTLEGMIHTLFSRFELSDEYLYEQQLFDFITNRKNIVVSQDGKEVKLPDYSVYSQGLQLFLEEIDEKDDQHRIRLSCREITTTPEKILVDLSNTKDASIVLCSATSSCASVVSNFDLEYLRQIQGNKVMSLLKEDREKFDELMEKTYPLKHKIEIVPIKQFCDFDPRQTHKELPEKYVSMFSQSAVKEGLHKIWFRIATKELPDYEITRLLQFIEVYHWFVNKPNVHSMLYFQNKSGEKDEAQMQCLSCLIDGTYKDMPSELDIAIPKDWKNAHLRTTKDLDVLETEILTQLSSDKDAKLMLVTAYNSFKAGTNMQYEIPKGLEGYVVGDNWEKEGEKLKKDWDAMFLQSPTNYLAMSEDGTEQTFERSLYNAMLKMAMLRERGCLTIHEMKQALDMAIANKLMFGKNFEGIENDKVAWAQTIIEQAVGRLCRTRNKPLTTYILFDESMLRFFNPAILDKSLTKEFRELAKYILTHQTEEDSPKDASEITRCNTANSMQSQLENIRRNALRFTVNKNAYEIDEDEDEETNGIPHSVHIAQIQNQSYKQTIIKHPVITSFDELEDDKRFFFARCYGDWKRNGENFYNYCMETKRYKIVPSSYNQGGKCNRTISPSYVRLDVLMKNPVIRKHFEDNGFATDWDKDGLILHPEILASDYAGEIGEEAFKALVLHYTNCTEGQIKHLEGKDYELADFVIINPDGTYRIAFDVKNMNPKADHNDRERDIPTSDKRKRKRERLGCNLITVNMLKLPQQSIADDEIAGLIDENGNILQENLKTLITFINGTV